MADLEKKIVIPLEGDASSLEKDITNVKKKVSKKGVDVPIKLDMSDVTDSIKNVNDSINSLHTSLGSIKKAFGQIKGYDREFRFANLQKELDSVSQKFNKLIQETNKGTSYINVRTMGLDETKENISVIANNLKELNRVKIDNSSFEKLADTLTRIEDLINSIVEGMDFDKLRPSSKIQHDIDKTTSSLDKLAKSEKQLQKLEKYFNGRTAQGIAKAFFEGEGFKKNIDKSNTSLKNLIKHMEDYVGLGGDLSDIKIPIWNAAIQDDDIKSLADVLKVLQNNKLTDIINNDAVSGDAKQISDLTIKLQRYNEELDKAKLKERNLNVSFDTTSMENFTKAIAGALEKVGNFSLNIPENFDFGGLSTENLDKIITKLDEIVKTIGNIGTLLTTGIDTSNLQTKELEIEVEPSVDTQDFVNKIEKQIKESGKKVKVDIDLFDEKDKDNFKLINNEAITGFQNDVNSTLKNIADTFGVDLSGAISSIEEELNKMSDKVDFDKLSSSLRESLLDIVQQFQTSLNNVSFSKEQTNEIYNLLKQWNDASNILLKSGNKDSERAALLNQSTGSVSNGYLFDKEDSFSGYILNELNKVSKGVSGKIGEIYDTWLHSHPIQKMLLGHQTTGANIGFSIDDLEIYKKKYLSSGVTNMMVANNGKYTNINWDGISEAIIDRVIKSFKSNDIFQDGVFRGKQAVENDVYNFDKQSEIMTQALISAMKSAGIANAESRVTVGNIENLKTDLSGLHQEEQEAAAEAQKFLDVLERISNTLVELSSKEFNFGISESSFDGILAKLDDVIQTIRTVDQVTDEVNLSLDTVSKNTKKISYHWGDLNNGYKSHGFGDEIHSYAEGLRNGGRGWADGTGTYTTSDINQYKNGDFSDPLKQLYAIDISNLNMYEAHIEEAAEEFYQFQHKLEQYVIAFGSGFTGFDDNLGDITSEDLYKEAKKVFTNYPKIFNEVFKDFEEFDTFIEEMVNLVGESGIKDDGGINAKKMFNFKKQYGNDDIKTRFMKKLGFQGIDLSGTSYDTLKSGSVIYDIKEAEIVEKYKTVDEAINKVGETARQTTQEVTELNTRVKQETDTVNVDIKPAIDANEFVTDISIELDNSGHKVGVKVEPDLSPVDFVSKVESELKESGEKVKIDVTPNVDAINFVTDIETNINNSGQVVQVNVEPNVDSSSGFINKITDQLKNQSIKIDIEPNVKFGDNSQATNNYNNEQEYENAKQVKYYNYMLKLFNEYIDLQETIKQGNRNIALGFSVLPEDIRQGKATQTSVKTQLAKYLDAAQMQSPEMQKIAEDAKIRLAAYVYSLNDTEKAQKIFGKNNQELFLEIQNMTESAKASLEAYNSAWDKLNKSISAAGAISKKSNMRFEERNELQDILGTGSIENAVQYLQEHIGLQIPVNTASQATNVKTENDSLSLLKQKVSEVTTAVDEKTRAFQEEEQVVIGTVQREISNLEYLDGQLLEIINTIDKLKTTPINLDIKFLDNESIDENITKFFADLNEKVKALDIDSLAKLSEALQGLKTTIKTAENLEMVAIALKEFRTGLSGISAEENNFLSSINSILSKTDQLRELCKILEASAKQIKEVENDISNNSENQGKDNQNKNPDKSNKKKNDALTKSKTVLTNFKEYVGDSVLLDTAFTNASKKIEEFNNRLQIGTLSLDNYNKEIKAIDKSLASMKNADTMLNNFQNAIGDNKNLNVAFSSAVEKVSELNEKVQNGTLSLGAYNRQISNIEKSLELAKEAEIFVNPNDIQAAEKAMKEYINTVSHGKADLKGLEVINDQLTVEWKDQNGIIQKLTVNYDQLTGAITSVQKPLKKALTDTKTFSDKVKQGWSNVLQYASSFMGFYEIVNAVRTGITYIRELDTALTEMRKVSDETVQSLKNFQKISFDIADSVGTTAVQIQNSTADWMRLGETLDEATESAKVANILFNVSEFESIDEATSSLVAMSAAYSELDKIEIVDKLNLIGNTFSISTDGLASALQKSASALKTAGNDMDEAIALVTAGNQVVQDPDSVGAGLRTIALRITGTEAAKEELESLGEDTSDFVVQTTAKSRKAIKDFTKVASNDFTGFDILDDNGNFKSTYEILLGISEIYQEIVETDKKYGSNMANGLLETLAGKNRANIAGSILQSPQVLKEAYEASINDSSGSAQEELNKYLDSIEGRISKFTNQIQEFWYNLISSETVKNIVDIGTWVVDLLGNIVSGLGEVGSWITIISGGLGIKKLFDKFSGKEHEGILSFFVKKEEFSEAVDGVKTSFTTAVSEMGSTGTKSLSNLGKSLWNTLTPLGKLSIGIGVASAAISVAVYAFDKYTETVDETKEKVKSLTDEYKSSLSEANNNADTIESLTDRYEELSKGVSKLGDNVALTDDEFKEYNSIVNQIADTFPELIQGYTQEGNAILSLKGNVEQLRDAYKEAQQEAYNLLIYGNGEDDADGNSIIKAWNDLKETNWWDKFKDWGYADVGGQISTKDAIEQLKEFQKLTANEYRNIETLTVLNNAQELTDLQREEYEALSELHRELGSVNYIEGALDLDPLLFTDEEFNAAKKQAQNLVEQYELEVKKGLENVQSLANAFLMTDSDYAKLDADTQKMASVLVNNMDEYTANQLAENGSMWDTKNYIDNLVNSISKNTDAQDAFSKLYEIDFSKMSVRDADKQISDYLHTIGVAIGESSKKLRKRLGFDEYAVAIYGTDGESSDSLVTRVKNVLNDEFDHLTTTLTLEDLQLAANIALEVDDNTLFTWDELNQKLEHTKYLGKDAVTSVHDIYKNLDLYTEASSYADLLPNGLISDKLNKVMNATALEIAPKNNKKFGLDAVNEEFESKVQDYIDNTNELQIAWAKLNDGNLTKGDLSDLMEMFPDWEFNTENLDDSIRHLLKNLNTNMLDDFASQFGEIDSDKDVQNLEAFMEAVLELGSTVGNTSFSIDINTESESYAKLATAMQESVSATGLSSESINHLRERYAALEAQGYDLDDMFEETTNGIHLNRKALNELEREYKAQNMEQFQDKLDDLQVEYEKLTGEIERCGDTARLSSLYSQRDDIINQINDIATLAAQYDGLTSAYNKWQTEQNAGNERDMYEGVISGRDEMEAEMKRGWFDDDSIAYLELMTGQELDTKTYVEQLEAYKSLSKKLNSAGYSIWDFFTKNDDGETTAEGVFNFFDTVKAAQDKLGKEWVKIDKKGNYTVDFGVNGDKAVAEALGISEELVQIILRAAKDAGFNINLDGARTELADFEDEVAAFNDRLKEYEATTYTFNINSKDINNLQTQLEEAQAAYDFLRSGKCNIDVSDEDLQNAKLLIASIIRQMQSLEEKPIVMDISIDKEKANSKIEQSVLAMQTFIDENYNLEVNLATGDSTVETQKEIRAKVQELKDMDPTIAATLKFDNAETQAAMDTILATTDADIEAGITLKEDALVVIENAINNVTPQMMVDAGLTDESVIKMIDSIIAAEEDAEVTVTIHKNSKEVDAYIQNLSVPDQFITFKPSTSALDNWLRDFKNTNLTKTIKIQYSDTEQLLGFGSKATGTAYAAGTVMSMWNNYRSSIGAYASGNWSLPRNESALVNELGTESIVRDGKWFTIPGGAHVEQLKKGDIIFNAQQTKELIETGRVISGGGHGQVAYADGTAHNMMNAYSNVTGGSKVTITGAVEKYGSKYSKDKDSSKDEFEETFDWIERKIEDIERKIDNLDRTASATYKSWTDRNNALVSEMSKVTEEISIQQQAYNRYIKEADSVGLSDKYKKLVQSGAIDIQTITDEALAEKIQKYQEFYDKAIECQDAAKELEDTLANLARTKFDNVIQQYDDKLSAIEHEINVLDALIDQTETSGHIVSSKYYDELIKQEQKNNALLEKEYSDLQTALTQAMKSGNIQENSEEWHSMMQEINGVHEAIIESNTAIIEYNNNLRQLEWDAFDRLQEKISNIVSETEFLISLMEDSELFDDRGQLTDTGMATLGLHGQNYNIAMAQAEKYAQELANIEKDLAKDSGNLDLIERKQELLDLQQESILAAKDEKNAIRDLVEEGIQLELESLQKLIDEYNKAQENAKSLYDYQKQIAEQTKEISALEKQMSAYQGDDSEENRQRIQQIKLQLEEAKQNLEETEMDHALNETQKMLDELYD